MDPVYALNQRLRYFAECLRNAEAKDCVPPSMEEWLEFWNDDDTDLGNLRNLEHWLSAAKAQRKHG